MNLNDRSGVITGAGSGIGRELALAFAQRGGHLLLVGRREQPLRDTARLVAKAGGTAEVLALDITAPGASHQVAAFAQERLHRVDLLVNNAGSVRAGRLEDHAADEIAAMVDLNLTAPILLTRELLPALRSHAREDGAIVLNIASGMALVGMPFYTVYAAAKAGLAKFGESLRRELHGSGIHVATVYPGATQTAMNDSVVPDASLGLERRDVTDVVSDLITALSAGEHEINTSLPARRAMQQLNLDDPLAVDRALAPQLGQFHSAVGNHRSM